MGDCSCTAAGCRERACVANATRLINVLAEAYLLPRSMAPMRVLSVVVAQPVCSVSVMRGTHRPAPSVLESVQGHSQ
jgi:hypothetical protein